MDKVQRLIVGATGVKKKKKDMVGDFQLVSEWFTTCSKVSVSDKD
jgi:hypothetical protein